MNQYSSVAQAIYHYIASKQVLALGFVEQYCTEHFICANLTIINLFSHFIFDN